MGLGLWVWLVSSLARCGSSSHGRNGHNCVFYNLFTSLNPRFIERSARNVKSYVLHSKTVLWLMGLDGVRAIRLFVLATPKLACLLTHE